MNVTAFAQWLASRLGVDRVELTDVRRHTEGFSWQTYTLQACWLDASGAAQQEGFALRVQPVDGLLAPYDIDGQYALHAALAGQPGIPMPKLYWLEKDPAVFGMPFYVMQRVTGEVPVQWRAQDPRIFPTPQARREIGLQFVDILAAIHAVPLSGDWLAHLHVEPSPEASARYWVRYWAEYYVNAALVPLPVVDYAIAWLERNLAHSPRLSLVHGDYRIGNFMLRDGRIVAIFDWELAHVGDPIEDIAYSGLPLFRGRNPLLSALLSPEDYFARYERQTSLAVHPDVFRFWTVLGLVKAAASHVRASRAFQTGRGDDLRLAAMGHQVEHVVRHLAGVLGLRRAA